MSKDIMSYYLLLLCIRTLEHFLTGRSNSNYPKIHIKQTIFCFGYYKNIRVCFPNYNTELKVAGDDLLNENTGR